MKMSRPEVLALRGFIGPERTGRWLSDARQIVSLTDIVAETCLAGRLGELAGRSVLLYVRDQLTAALAMMEIDGVARRMLLCPPDLSVDHIGSLMEDAEIDAVVVDDATKAMLPGIGLVVTAGALARAGGRTQTERSTEWLMLTSGTSGPPKVVGHSLQALSGAFVTDQPSGGAPQVWSTFYDIRRYGGLQIFLRAVIGGGSMVLSDPKESIADYVARLRDRGVSHISGTPSHWRKLLMSGAAEPFAPRYVRLSGEIADQAVLDGLRKAFPEASIGHAYASTEAGVGFAVTDGLAGFPAGLIGQSRDGVDMKVEDGSLRIRSSRTANGYLGGAAAALKDADGFVDTGDMVELRGERYYFIGRRGGIINIGGLKVHPEEIEAVINRHAEVRMSRARSRRSPITGAIVTADVVLADGVDVSRRDAIRDGILTACREQLPSHKVPAVIKFVPSLDISAAGKLARHDA
jgi:acyl-CoA synthetase (AMP-forming)/AMP-acid ligase II